MSDLRYCRKCNEAMSYVNQISEVHAISTAMENTIKYAKFKITLKEGDYLNAETLMNDLFASDIAFGMAMDIIKSYVEISSTTSSYKITLATVMKYFRALLGRFSRYDCNKLLDNGNNIISFK